MTRPLALWQRNVVGAVVTAVAIGAFIVIDLGPQWSTYRHAVVPEHVVPAGRSGTADGQTWALGSIGHLNRSPLNFGPPLPSGTVLTIIEIDRAGQPTDGLCNGVITDGERRWDSEGVGGFSPIPPDGATSMCHEPGRLQFAFVLPRDVVPTALDVTMNGQIAVRLLL